MGILNWLNWLKGIFGRRGAPMLPPPGSGGEGSEADGAAPPDAATKADAPAADSVPEKPEGDGNARQPRQGKAPDPRLSKSKEELCEELDKANDTIGKLKLAYADVLNDQKSFQKRLQKEKERAIGEGVCKVTRDLLDISDELERALAAVQDDKGPLAEGVRMVHGSMRTRLEKLGVTRMELVGTYFDPNKAEALDVVPVQSQDQDGVVIQELRPGFMLGGTVLREARVCVGKWIPPAPPPAPEPEASKEEPPAQGDAEAPAKDASADSSPSTASEGASATAAPSGETAPEAAAPSSGKAVEAATSTEAASSDAVSAPTAATSATSAEAVDVKAEAASEGKPA